MKLEYQAIELRRGDKWHCNFCSFEKERSLTATVTVGGINGVGEPIIWCVGVFANQGISKLASAYRYPYYSDCLFDWILKLQVTII